MLDHSEILCCNNNHWSYFCTKTYYCSHHIKKYYKDSIKCFIQPLSLLFILFEPHPFTIPWYMKHILTSKPLGLALLFAWLSLLHCLLLSVHCVPWPPYIKQNPLPSTFSIPSPAFIIFPALILTWHILFFHCFSSLKCDLHENREVLFVHCCLS